MFKIDRDALYSRADLAAALEPLGVDVDHFTARVKARKVFRQCWLGADLIEALRTAPALGEVSGPVEVTAKETGKRRGAGRLDTSRLDRLAKG